MCSRRGKNTPHHHHHQQRDQTDENWSLRPIINNHDVQTHETTTSSSSTSQPFSTLHPKHQNRGAKSQLVNKSEKGKEVEEGSNAGSVSRLQFDSNCGNINETDENCVSGVEGSSSSDGIGEEDDDVGVKRLEEELRLSVEQLGLSEELMSINNQLQEDELLAMESIYGDNIFILDNKSCFKCFQTHIHIEGPEGICITAKFNPANSLDRIDKDPTDFSYSFRIEYIPPIKLTCLLPKSYPSNRAPFFSISVQWLSSAKISDLCCKLDSIWQEQAGQEVIYQWVEWLQSCTLSYLGFDDEIVLGPYGVRHDEDRRAISRSVSPDIDIPFLKSSNDEQRHENFCRNIQECCICFNEFSEDEDNHAQCSKCYYSFCTLCMDRRHVGIQCLASEVKLLMLQDRQNSNSLTDDQRRKLADLINQIHSLKEIKCSAKQCPCCKMAISRIEGCNKMVCKNCGAYFCYRCNHQIFGYNHFWKIVRRSSRHYGPKGCKQHAVEDNRDER
ncbi:hypothetical protein BUALT_Bualt10G0012400 [Buddleja alternifolia]|uniref:Uncharacterized protein n=1 Tax=Buddleja alternifolia TaxID=168488 RepID=A0AAV6WVZ4_9LAMI|nr:hypothetical protein BUALT_Bualt10G0012400 [Buddleja alternifolia]